MMWLLLTAAAALGATVLWRVSTPGDRYRLGFLSLVYWGATLMWLVDHVMAYVQNGGPFFEIDANATWLGLSVVALGIFLWLVRLLFSYHREVSRVIFRKG